MFLTDCSACGWESAAADLAEVAATMGVEHLARAHPAAIAARDVSYIRVWEYRVFTAAELAPEPGPEPEPPPPPPTPAPRAAGHTPTPETARHAGRKRS